MRKPFLSLFLLGVLAGCGPLPGTYRAEPPPEATYEGPQVEPGDEPLVVVDTGREGTYYVIDPNRRLCFFQDQGSMTAIDCASLPEAADVLGGAGEPEPPAVPPGGREPEVVAPDPDAPPEAEQQAFVRAYLAIFCDVRAERTANLTEHITREGLTPARYSQIEGWFAADETRRRWLEHEAVRTCPVVE